MKLMLFSFESNKNIFKTLWTFFSLGNNTNELTWLFLPKTNWNLYLYITLYVRVVTLCYKCVIKSLPCATKNIKVTTLCYKYNRGATLYYIRDATMCYK